MPARKIEAIDFNGETIYVEVSEVEDETSGEETEYTSADETATKLVGAGEQIRSTISALATTVQNALSKAPPAEWTLEINIGIKATGGIPFITEGEASGAIIVKATWKNTSGNSTA